MMTEHHSIADARRNLPRLIHEAERGKTVRLARRGEPVAVLVGHRTFERIVAGRRGFGEAYAEFARAVDLAELAFTRQSFRRAFGIRSRSALYGRCCIDIS